GRGGQKTVGFGQPGVSQRVVRVKVARLQETFNAFLDPIGRTLVDEVAAFQVEAIGLSVVGVTFDQLLALLTAQLQPQLSADLLRYVALQREDVGERAALLLAPELSVTAHVYKFGLDDQRIAELQNAPGEHGAHAQLPADFLRIDFLAFVAKNRAARDDAQLRQLREAIDDAFGDAVSEIFHLRVGAVVGQRQDRQRIDRATGTAANRRRNDLIRKAADLGS